MMVEAEENPMRMPKLGMWFWALWWSALILVTAAFLSGLLYLIFQDMWSAWTGTAVTVVFSAVVIALSMMPYVMARRRNLAPRLRAPHRRYMMRFIPAMLVYTLFLTPAISYFQSAKPTGVLAWAIAMAPVIPLLFAIRAILLYYKEEDDEFVRSMATQAHLLATGFMMAIATAYGFLDMFGLVPHVQMWAVFPAWALCLFPAQAITYRKFR